MILRPRRRRRTRRARRAPAAILTVLLAGAGSLLGATPAVAAPGAHAVTVTVESLSATTVTATVAAQPLTIVLSLHNTTSEALDGLTLHSYRGAPVQTASALSAAIADPQRPDSGEISIVTSPTGASLDQTVSLAPGASETVTLRTATSAEQYQGICVCLPRLQQGSPDQGPAGAGVYPLWFSVSTDPFDNDVVGTAQTFLSAFTNTPPRLQVSWLWPLIDSPHRLGTEGDFLDDSLATSVSSGRLFRLLQVARQVTPQVPLTLVVDPELIDELAVMSAGPYRVAAPGGVGGTVAGTGTAAAAAWLSTLRAVLKEPGVDLEFTAPDDPDMQSMTANALSWAAALPADAQLRVVQALGRVAGTGLVWPVGETLDATTLAAAVDHGASTVVLDSAAITQPNGSSATATVALRSITTAGGSVTAAVTSPEIEHYIPGLVSRTGSGLGALPLLVSQLAMRMVEEVQQQVDLSQFVVITPPRNLDPDPATAVPAILATARTIWSTGVGLATATATLPPSGTSELSAAAGQSGVAPLPDAIVSGIQQLLQLQPALSSMLPSETADSQLGWIPGAVQSLESNAWRTAPDTGQSRADLALQRLDGLRNGVHIVRPSSGSYTLGSSNAPLPLTLVNTLSSPVVVNLSVLPTGAGIYGFSANAVTNIHIPSKSQITERITTHVDRTGRFQVVANLTTPQGASALGTPIPLTLRSTVLGTIGIVITIVAGVVLVLALALRWGRRWRRRGAAPAEPDDLGPIPA